MTTRKNLEIPRGQTLEFVVDVAGGPATLNGYVCSMQIRELRHDTEVLGEVPESAFTVNPSTRQVTVRIPGEVTESINLGEAGGVYDLLLTGPSGDAWRLLEGRVYSTLSVTRED